MANKLPTMIHFFGPDGAGKSTHVNILLKIFAEKNVRAKKCWVRSPHTLAFILWRFFVKVGFCRTVYNCLGVPFKFPAVDRNKGLRIFWVVIEFISIFPLLIKVRYWLFKGYKLIAERYILDSVVTIAYFINDIDFLKGRIARLLFRFIPKNTTFIFLDANYRTIYQRRAPPCISEHKFQNSYKSYEIGHLRSVEPRDFIEFQRNAYHFLAYIFNPLIIDTTKHSIKETSNVILQYLGVD